MTCPKCGSKKTNEVFLKEEKTPVYENMCHECDCLFNDEDDYLAL